MRQGSAHRVRMNSNVLHDSSLIFEYLKLKILRFQPLKKSPPGNPPFTRAHIEASTVESIVERVVSSQCLKRTVCISRKFFFGLLIGRFDCPPEEELHAFLHYVEAVYRSIPKGHLCRAPCWPERSRRRASVCADGHQIVLLSCCRCDLVCPSRASPSTSLSGEPSQPFPRSLTSNEFPPSQMPTRCRSPILIYFFRFDAFGRE